ncbi:histidine phosphatase family protein [Cerasicoccus fimbriatus]|uniref:histidine phosphatase family protein n=1 Tax=Cerasicoccus fimbriatus TaxID=3014554 RepID=UPI0022B3118D|nr:histidine phosphatase family protein [Cerasicoccus sp. TK19100]
MSDFPKIILARHGETDWTISRQHTGRTDLPLTEGGRKEAEHVRQRLADQCDGHEYCPMPKHVFSSPLKRAKETCEIVTGSHGFGLWDDLMEWNYGDYEGLTTKEIQVNNPGWNIFKDGAPGGESVAEISARADRVVARLREIDSPELFVFSHGHFLRVLMARWLNQPAAAGAYFVLSTAAVVVVGYEHNLDEPCIRF